MTGQLIYEITYTNQRTNHMEQRENLTVADWFQFLLLEKSREEEWKKIADKFPAEQILQAYIDMPDGDLKQIVAILIEDNYLLFSSTPVFKEAIKSTGRYPRQHEEEGRFPL